MACDDLNCFSYTYTSLDLPERISRCRRLPFATATATTYLLSVPTVNRSPTVLFVVDWTMHCVLTIRYMHHHLSSSLPRKHLV